MLKDTAITLLYLLLFNIFIYRFKWLQFKAFKPFVTAAIFNLKFIAGVIVFCIYTYYYKDVENNDIHKYYADALVLRNTAGSNAPVFFDLMLKGHTTLQGAPVLKNWDRNFDEAPVNENRTVIRLNALLSFITLKTYMAHLVIMCLVSLLGWVLLYNTVQTYAGYLKPGLTLVTLLLPSALLWTSGVMKEPLLVLGMGTFIAGLLCARPARAIGGLLAGALIILSVKFYVLACLLPAALAFFIFKNRHAPVFTLVKYAVLYVLFTIAAFNLPLVVPSLNPAVMLANKQEHSIKEAIYFNAGSRINIPVVQPRAASILKAFPNAIYATLARPYAWENRNPMMLASGLENFLLLVYVIFTLLYMRRANVQHLNLILFLLAFALSYFAVIGICTPVLGNLVRYRAPLLPVFMLGLALACRKDLPLLSSAYGKKLHRYLFAE